MDIGQLTSKNILGPLSYLSLLSRTFQWSTFQNNSPENIYTIFSCFLSEQEHGEASSSISQSSNCKLRNLRHNLVVARHFL